MKITLEQAISIVKEYANNPKEEAKEFVLKFGKEEFISLNILEEWLGFTLEDWEKEHIF